MRALALVLLREVALKRLETLALDTRQRDDAGRPPPSGAPRRERRGLGTGAPCYEPWAALPGVIALPRFRSHAARAWSLRSRSSASVAIASLVGRAIEVHTEPKAGRFAQVRRVDSGGRVSPGAFPELVLGVADILPPG